MVQHVKSVDFTRDQALAVMQHEYAFTTLTHPVVGTTSLSTCVALAFYCSATRQAFLIHVDFKLTPAQSDLIRRAAEKIAAEGNLSSL